MSAAFEEKIIGNRSRNRKDNDLVEEDKEKVGATGTTTVSATPPAFNGNKGEFCVQSYHKDYYSYEKVE